MLWWEGLSVGCQKMDSSPLFVINFYDPETPLTFPALHFLSYEVKGWDSILASQRKERTHPHQNHPRALQTQTPLAPTLID